MADVLEVIWHGLRDSFLMAWEVWWALVLGFAISGIVQAWVPRTRIERAMSGAGPKPVALATGLGAASSSCSPPRTRTATEAAFGAQTRKAARPPPSGIAPSGRESRDVSAPAKTGRESTRAARV